MLKASTKRAIKRYRRAVEVHAFKGTQHPDDHEGIEGELAAAEKDLHAAIEREKSDAR